MKSQLVFLLAFSTCCIAQANSKLVSTSSIIVGDMKYERSVFIDLDSGESRYQYTDENRMVLTKTQLERRHPVRNTVGIQPIFSPELDEKMKRSGLYDEFLVLVMLSRDGEIIPQSRPDHSIANENERQQLERRKRHIEARRVEREKHFLRMLNRIDSRNQWKTATIREKFSDEIVKFSLTHRGIAKMVLSKEELLDIQENGAGIIRSVSLVHDIEELVGSALISSKIDPYALTTAGHQGDGIGIMMSELGCPPQGILPNYHVEIPIPNGTNNQILHSVKVAEVLRYTSLDGHITCGGWEEIPPFSFQLAPNAAVGKPQAHVYNGSWGVLDSNFGDTYREADGFWDQFVYEERISAIFAGGNDGLELHEMGTFVPTPAKSFNAVAVGYHANDHHMKLQSSYSNPITRTEKPELVAPGDIMSTPLDPIDRGGSSFAAPQVAGSAANLIGANNALKFSPHATKALLLTAATRKITIPNSSNYATRERIGEGGLDYERVHDNSKFNVKQWNGTSHTAFNWYAQNDNGVSSNYIEHRVWIPQSSSQVRAALSWLVSGDFANGQTQWHQKLGSGFNLFAFGPTGSYLGGSWDYYDSYAVFDFNATIGGWYRFFIDREYQRDLSGDLSLALAVNWGDRED